MQTCIPALYLGTGNIHPSSHESVLCLLHIIDLQNISTSKLYFIQKRLTVLKEINWETNSGGFYSGFTGFLLANWLHYTQGPVYGEQIITICYLGQNIIIFQPENFCPMVFVIQWIHLPQQTQGNFNNLIHYCKLPVISPWLIQLH